MTLPLSTELVKVCLIYPPKVLLKEITFRKTKMNQNKVIPAIKKKLIAKKMSMLRIVFSTVFATLKALSFPILPLSQ